MEEVVINITEVVEQITLNISRLDSVPVGGAAGQVLAKKNNLNYATEWITIPAGAVSSVNGQTGVVVLNAASVNADPAGSAANALISANGYTDSGLALKQDLLVSGTNLKTLNGIPLLGSGNITISGGGGSVSLTHTYIGVGDAANAVSGSANFTRDLTTGKIRIGNANVGGAFSEDTDSMVVIARITDPTVNSNGHGFVDASNFSKNSNGFAYNSFTNNVKFLGSANYDHYAAFQAAWSHNGTGTTSRYYGLFDAPTVSTGATLGTRTGIYIADVAGAGNLTSNVGIYIATLAKGSGTKYAFQSVSNDSFFGGRIRLVTSGGSNGSLTPELAFYHGTTFRTSYIVSALLANSSTQYFYVSQSNLQGHLKLFELIGDSGNGLGNSTGTIFANGKMRVGNNAAYPTSTLDVVSLSNAAHIRFIANATAVLSNDGEMIFDGTNLKIRVGGVVKTFTLT